MIPALRALVQLVPRAGAGDRFAAQVAAVVAGLRARAADRGLAVHALHRLAHDRFGQRTAFRAGFEISGGEAPALEEVLGAGLGSQLGEVAHPDASALVIGEDAVFVPPPHAPVRYQYWMRRNASFTHDDYLAYYRTKHSQFGLVTPGALGYVQLHVDPAASRRACARAGVGLWGFDSVSELHLESQEAFVRALAESGFGKDAIADEEVFVDRASSVDLCAAVD